MQVERFFSAQDLERIKAAVGHAEAGTGGEIVPAVVASSDHYDEAGWAGAALGAITLPVVAAFAYHAGEFWGLSSPYWIGAPAAVGAALGFLATLLPAVKRRLIPRHELDRQVQHRAALAFLEHEVFATRDRTGVLIFLSLFERRVVVLADAGINARVEQHEWDRIVASIVAGLRAGRAGEALVAAIGQCGELLARRGVVRQADDTNELPDGLRVEKE